MALMDEFREERENILKNGTKKEKLAYFWEYYKWYVIIPAIIIIAVGSYIHHLVTAPEPLLNGVLLNVTEINTEEIIADFCKEQEIDTDDYSVDLNTGVNYVANDDTGMANYESSQALMAWVSAGSVDFINGDLESVTELAYKGYFVDLTEVLSEEQIEKYEPYFLYIDQEIITEVNRLQDANEEMPDIETPDCTKPEEMEDPIPVMIDMSKCEVLAEGYANAEKGLALGMTVKSEHAEMVLEFIDYLMEE
ncbi:MAG: hypothetical protein IJZ53_01540 [Tyzzerella sp.]|nr:hypothetical protein [Tyzzerella sp.]